MAPIGRLIRPTKHLRIHGFDAPFPESSFTSNDMEQSITQERPGGPNALTDQSYWSNYYGRHRQPSPNSESIIAAGSRLDNCWDETIKAAGTPKTIWEIGCYPGRYLAYVAARHGMRALGLDFNDDTETVERNLAAMGVTDFKAIQADFSPTFPRKRQTSSSLWGLSSTSRIWTMSSIGISTIYPTVVPFLSLCRTCAGSSTHTNYWSTGRT